MLRTTSHTRTIAKNYIDLEVTAVVRHIKRSLPQKPDGRRLKFREFSCVIFPVASSVIGCSTTPLSVKMNGFSTFTHATFSRN